MRKYQFYLAGIGIFISGFLAGWYCLALLMQPDPSDLLDKLASGYFKTASAAGVIADVSYKDCRVDPPSASDKANGTLAIGICSSEKGKKPLYYMVAFSETGGIDYFDEDGF